jgi:valyl-tRNA synthetase
MNDTNQLESNFTIAYNPKHYEQPIYQKWLDEDIFSPQTKSSTVGVYSILMPPPNLTGDLHAGHAFQHYLMDTLSRKARLDSKKTLFFPGVDHAGLQLEGVIDKMIDQGDFNLIITQKLTKVNSNITNQILKSVEAKTLELSRIIKAQLPTLWMELAWSKVELWRTNQRQQSSILGDSADYQRELFTLDDEACKMVYFAFKKYWQDGLIYKDKYLINWSIGLQTALSDVAEDIAYTSRIDPFVTFYYFFEGLKIITANEQLEQLNMQLLVDFLLANPLKVATVRPETIFGDMAVAIHPELFVSYLRDASYNQDQIRLIINEIATKNLVLTFAIPSLGSGTTKAVSGAILILSDKVDKEFGTGALKITPASDIIDYQIWNEHYQGHSFTHAITKLGKISSIGQNFEGQDVDQARLNIIYHMATRGVMVAKSNQTTKEYGSYDYDINKNYKDNLNILQSVLGDDFEINFNYEHNVTICDRSKTIVEPLISEEVFISVNHKAKSTGLTLKEHALGGISKVKFYPQEYQIRGQNFLSGLKDWCISRNLLWGHQFPVFYNNDTNPEQKFYTYLEYQNSKLVQNKFFIGTHQELKAHVLALGSNLNSWTQDQKRLDTWFSSSLWPLTTFGYYDYFNKQETLKAHDFKTFYPTSALTTAKEIFNIWVCRMIMLSSYFTMQLPKTDNLFNSIPFKDVVITPTVLDDNGKKMSKSLGNGLNPVLQVDKFSSDSLRMAMLSSMIPDRNMKLGAKIADKLCEKYRNLGNKIWNIVRFLDTKNAFSKTLSTDGNLFNTSIASFWLLDQYKELCDLYQEGFDNYQLTEVINSIYSFVFDKLAPWALEYQKTITDPEVIDQDLAIFGLVLKDLIYKVAPFLPFEAEVLHQKIFKKDLVNEGVNQAHKTKLQTFLTLLELKQVDVTNFTDLIKIIDLIRSTKGLFGVPAGDRLEYITNLEVCIQNQSFIKQMTRCEIALIKDQNFVEVYPGFWLKVLDKITDKSKELQRANKTILELQKLITSLELTLTNQKFVDNADQMVLEQKNQDLADRREDLELQINKVKLLS